jgi:hypothetical protein
MPNSAAGQIWPHLRQGTPEPVEQQQRTPNSVADAMYPRPPKPPSNPYRDSLLRGLRELNRKIDERMERERRC